MGHPDIVDTSAHSGTSEKAKYKSVSLPYNHTKPTQPYMFLSRSSFSNVPKLQGRGERMQRREAIPTCPLLTLSQNSAGGTGVISHRDTDVPHHLGCKVGKRGDTAIGLLSQVKAKPLGGKMRHSHQKTT